MTLLLHRSALLSQGQRDGGPPSGAYQPPAAGEIALVFAGGPYTAPDSSTIPLSFGPPPASAPGPYAPPSASDLPLSFTWGAFNPPLPNAIILEF